ncbi:MAG: M81 family metallopeptidase [Planctomycetota bacterium]|nr:M81 family metallopeptidase [Planctomycetota bacterium]
MKRIGIGGIAIESCTFSPLFAAIEDFTVLRGEEMSRRYPFLPGWVFRGLTGLAFFPCLHANALPGGRVKAETYAALKTELLDRIAAVLPLDGLYLDIHGAGGIIFPAPV